MRVSLLRVAGSIVHSSQDAEDAVSAAIVRAYQHADTLRDEKQMKPWMMKITVRCCYDQLRKSRREYPTDQEEVFDAPVFQPNVTLYETLLELPPTLRQVLTLYYYEGFSTAQIAAVLGIAGPTVLMRLSRGRKLLRTVLEGATKE